MSLSSKARKESTESYAAQQMRNTMGVAPELSQLSKTDRPGVELPSESHQSNDVEIEDVMPIDDEPNPVQNDANLNSADVSDQALSRDEDGDLAGTTWNKDRVPGADWNRDTDKPEQEQLGHS
ncbi:hypothetical protein [Larkinella sp. C7]|jgi:hypothetical protein|uniref:hypothetical protein n=1 Tax=Larkinella sp. C7 TaxID=2576607 RepID=UPI0011113649|nr:hypothetical protein [Larkinella sp. C7]